eukprot:XP_020407918.1 atherin-like [Zea mays]
MAAVPPARTARPPARRGSPAPRLVPAPPRPCPDTVVASSGPAPAPLLGAVAGPPARPWHGFPSPPDLAPGPDAAGARPLGLTRLCSRRVCPGWPRRGPPRPAVVAPVRGRVPPACPARGRGGPARHDRGYGAVGPRHSPTARAAHSLTSPSLPALPPLAARAPCSSRALPAPLPATPEHRRRSPRVPPSERAPACAPCSAPCCPRALPLPAHAACAHARPGNSPTILPATPSLSITVAPTISGHPAIFAIFPG